MPTLNHASYPNLYTDHNGHLCLLYSEHQENPDKRWKLKTKNLITNATINIETPKYHQEYGAVISETHPHYRLDNQNRLNLCYIAEFHKNNIPNKHALCYILTKDLSFKFTDYVNLNIAQDTSVGYLGQNKTIYLPHEQTTQLSVLQNENTQNIQFTNFDITDILSIKSINNNNQYLLTTSNSQHKVKTYLLNPNLEIVQEILNIDGQSVMFGSVLNNNLAHTTINEYNIPGIELEQHNL